MTPSLTVASDSEGYYEEKRSRFISQAFHVSSSEEAQSRLAQVRRAFYDARHHVFAYTLLPSGSTQIQSRFSDDGEPSGTAGKPILDVLTGAGLKNTMVIVTRYFGGTLLGTGGLVRAYSSAAKDALSKARIVKVRSFQRLRIDAAYGVWPKVQYLLTHAPYETAPVVEETAYAEHVSVTFLLSPEDQDALIRAVGDLSGGTARISPLGCVEGYLDRAQVRTF